MKTIRRIALLIAIALMIAVLPNLAGATDVTVKMCAANGASSAGLTIQAREAQSYTADVNGCIAFNVTKDVNGNGMRTLLNQGWSRPSQLSLGWDGALGAIGSSGVKPFVAPCAGHFSKLACTATLTGSCTTGPTINVTDVTGSTTGTAVSPTTTVATVASASETLTFASGDTIGFAQTATTGTCTAPAYACSATLSCP